MRLSHYFEGLPRGHTYVVSLALVLLLGIVDYVTGAEWAFSLFYLLPIALAAWVAGRPAGIRMAFFTLAQAGAAPAVTPLTPATPQEPNAAV